MNKRQLLIVGTTLICAASLMVALQYFGSLNAKRGFVGCAQNLVTLGSACEAYALDNGRNYPRTLQDLSPTYVQSVPSCPVAQRDTYSGSYQFVDGSIYTGRFTIYCRGSYHADFAPGADKPMYDSRKGIPMHTWR